MAIPIEYVEIITVSATWVTKGIGASLATAVLGAAWEAAAPGMPTRVWAWLIEAVTVALRVFALVLTSPVVLAYGLAVTYLHVWTPQRAQHRYSHVSAWREGTYSAGSVTA